MTKEDYADSEQYINQLERENELMAKDIQSIPDLLAENERLTVELANAVEAVRQAEASKNYLADALADASDMLADTSDKLADARDAAREIAAGR